MLHSHDSNPELLKKLPTLPSPRLTARCTAARLRAWDAEEEQPDNIAPAACILYCTPTGYCRIQCVAIHLEMFVFNAVSKLVHQQHHLPFEQPNAHSAAIPWDWSETALSFCPSSLQPASLAREAEDELEEMSTPLMSVVFLRATSPFSIKIN